MPKTRPWEQLRSKLPDTPELREQSKQRGRAMNVGLLLGELQDASWTTPDGQHEISSIEHEEDVYLSTLRDAVEMLGGQLEITAVFPDRKVRLVPAEDE